MQRGPQPRAEMPGRSWGSFKNTGLEMYASRRPLAGWVVFGKHNTLPSCKIRDVKEKDQN